MVSLKIQKRSVLVLILTLILFSGNTIIIGYLTPLLYLSLIHISLWFMNNILEVLHLNRGSEIEHVMLK